MKSDSQTYEFSAREDCKFTAVFTQNNVNNSIENDVNNSDKVDPSYNTQSQSTSSNKKRTIISNDNKKNNHTIAEPIKLTVSEKLEWTNPYVDINEKAWYYPAVCYVSENGLMTGAENSYTFAPNSNLSRAMLAQILYNKEGKPAVGKGSGFADVPSGAWYEDAVTWAAENNIVSGYVDGRFAPNDSVTREQLVVMLWRYFDSPSAEGLLAFIDAGSIREYAKEAMTWAVSNNIISGFEDSSLLPSGTASRVQVAQILKSCMN